MPTRNIANADGTWRETYEVDAQGVERVTGRQLVTESPAFTTEREARRTASEAAAAKEATLSNVLDTLGRRALRYQRNPTTNAADKLTDVQMHRLVGAIALALGKVLGEDL